MDEPNWLAEVNSVTLWFALSRINTCNVGFVLGTKLLAAFSGLGSLTMLAIKLRPSQLDLRKRKITK